MKILLFLSLVTLACSARLYINRPVYILEVLRDKTLADDFRDLKALIPERELEDLFRRYLLNDAEFQSIIRYFGTPEVFKAIQKIRDQPEIKQFNQWLQQQLPYGLEDYSDEDSRELYELLNRRPYDLPSRGWKGFMEELLAIYPRDKINSLIREKADGKGVFAEFWKRINALKPVYERILKLPEVRKVIEKLQQLGVDTAQLNQLIRDDFGWTLRIIEDIQGYKHGRLPAQQPGPIILAGAGNKP